MDKRAELDELRARRAAEEKVPERPVPVVIFLFPRLRSKLFALGVYRGNLACVYYCNRDKSRSKNNLTTESVHVILLAEKSGS